MISTEVDTSNNTSAVSVGRTDVRQTFAVLLSAKRCPAKATHTRLHFIADTHRQFLLQVQAPNGELSPLFYFIDDTQTIRIFQPKYAGCGHGIWKVSIRITSIRTHHMFQIEIYEYVHNRFAFVNRHRIELNGTGDVYMRIDDARLQLRIDEYLSTNYRRNFVDFNCHRSIDRASNNMSTRLQSIAANLTNISLLLKYIFRPEKFIIMEDRALCWTQYITRWSCT